MILRRSKLLRSKIDISRSAVVDPTVCDVVQFSPREVSIIGKSQGATNVTFWFQDRNGSAADLPGARDSGPGSQTAPRTEVCDAGGDHCQAVSQQQGETDSGGRQAVGDGSGPRRGRGGPDHGVIRGEATDQQGRWLGGHLVEGTTTGPMTAEEVGRSFTASQVINMLRIPGVQQVALRVKIAELNRTAARSFGVDLNMTYRRFTAGPSSSNRC